MRNTHNPAELESAGVDSKQEFDVTADDRDRGRFAGSTESDNSNISDAQAGVQHVEAIASAWTTRGLIIAYIIIWLVYFFETMMAVVTSSVTPYVTSAYSEHSLTPTVSILSSIIGGCCNLTMAKILDVVGRPQGYLLCIIFATIGLIMMAACNSVEMYAAAQVFYTVGNNMLQYTLGIFVADTTKLRNRGLMVGYYSSPNFITVWLAGPMSQAFLNGPGWKWCYGTFSIIIPVVSLPLFFLFLYYQIKADKQGLMPKNPSKRSSWQAFLYYCREFDVVGLLLLTAGLALFLLPFNLYSVQKDGWHSKLIICFLVFGVALMLSFAVWETFLAPVKFIPFNLLTDRTVLGAYVLGATLFASYYCWNAYFSSFLQVVNNTSVSRATYVSNAYSVLSTFSSIAVGVVIRYTGRYKPVTLYFAVPLSILGVGLMIYFRQPGQSLGYIVMCQVFMGFAAGIIIICDQVAAVASCSHQHIAAIIAVDSMFSSIGGAIGLSIAAAIWTGVFPVKLASYLPADQLENLLLIYADLTTQLSYPVGSPTRLAIQYAYGDAQKMMLIAATAFWAVGVVAVLVWRDTNVMHIKQVRGHVI